MNILRRPKNPKFLPREYKLDRQGQSWWNKEFNTYTVGKHTPWENIPQVYDFIDRQWLIDAEISGHLELSSWPETHQVKAEVQLQRLISISYSLPQLPYQLWKGKEQ
jgi:hypothetical protein